MRNHQSFYLSQTNCLKCDFSCKPQKKSKTEGGFLRADGAAGAVGGVTLYNYTGFVAQLSIYSNLLWQENAQMDFSLGYFLVSGILTLPKPLWTQQPCLQRSETGLKIFVTVETIKSRPALQAALQNVNTHIFIQGLQSLVINHGVVHI